MARGLARILAQGSGAAAGGFGGAGASRGGCAACASFASFGNGGSGFMMLTGGIEAAEGKSYLSGTGALAGASCSLAPATGTAGASLTATGTDLSHAAA